MLAQKQTWSKYYVGISNQDVGHHPESDFWLIAFCRREEKTSAWIGGLGSLHGLDSLGSLHGLDSLGRLYGLCCWWGLLNLLGSGDILYSWGLLGFECLVTLGRDAL